MPRKIIIDTDPGVDDAMAIQFALASPQLDLIGLTTVFGNVSVDLTTTNALRLLDVANRPDIPVAKGASEPLSGTFGGGVPFVHGDDGQGNTFRPTSLNQPVADTAAAFLVKQVLAYPKQVTIIAVGPLTNLAQALTLNPAIVDAVAEVVIMGGNAFCAGNATPAGEANVLADPDAADLVLGAGWPITMIGLDVTHQVNLTSAQIAQLANQPGPLNALVSAMVPFYRDFYERVNKIDGIYVHDSSAVAYVLAPQLFTCKRYPVRVDTSMGIGRGKTWPSISESDHEGSEALRPWLNRPLVNVAVAVDGPAVIDLMLHTIQEQQA